MESYRIPSNAAFGFSAVRPDTLSETEYTIASIVMDKSPSVSSFANQLQDCEKVAIDSCRKSPRANNLLLRLTRFNSNIQEVFGFKPLSDIDVSRDVPSYQTDGLTSLYDASYEAIIAVDEYAKKLVAQDYDVNGIVFVVTDGMDNTSRNATPASIKKLLETIRFEEHLESLTTVLVGVNAGSCKSYFENFKDMAGIDTFVDLGDVTPSKLAKLAGFISRSISTTSQNLGVVGSAPTSTSLSF